MPSTAELKAAFLDSIKPGVSLDDAFFRKLYGWSMTDPDFLETAVFTGETLWGLPIREPYQSWVQAYEVEQERINREVGEWYGKWIEQRKEVTQENGGRYQAGRGRHQRLPQVF